MKKIILIILLISFYMILIAKKVEKTSIENIDFNLREDESVLTFISSNNKALFFKKTNDLIILDYNKNINETLNTFNVKKINNLIYIENYKSDINAKYTYYLNDLVDLDYLKIYKNENIIDILYNGYKLCIYKNGSNNKIDDCDFVYFLSINNNLDIKDNILAVFYDKNIDNKYLEKYYDMWVDSYVIDSKSYTTIKFNKEDYEIITIPLEN